MMLSSSLSVLCLIMTTVLMQFCWSNPSDFLDSNGRQRRTLSRQEAEDLDAELAVLTQYLWEKKLTESKRGLDFGLSRGYSGSQTAKQLMGLAAANFANGPGRKRRDVSED